MLGRFLRGTFRGALESLGALLIAGAAKVGGCEAIVTRDACEFERIGLLRVERH